MRRIGERIYKWENKFTNGKNIFTNGKTIFVRRENSEWSAKKSARSFKGLTVENEELITASAAAWGVFEVDVDRPVIEATLHNVHGVDAILGEPVLQWWCD